MFSITVPHRPKIKKVTPNQAIFEIEACYPGYGLTLGNALRRVLLSSLPGAAITAFKIKNVPHEFTTIPYVQEDVIEILLNLKKIRFKLHSDEPIIGKISVKGHKKVLAKDIQLPSDAEVVNKDSLIATLTHTKAEFIAEVLIEKGIGYFTAEENKLRRELSADMISIDSVFSPIQKVNFKVEDMRVGEKTNYNKLFFDITTDGTVSPEEAFKYAVKTLISQFEVFLHEESISDQKQESSKQDNKLTSETLKDQSKEIDSQNILKLDIDVLKLPSRINNALKANKIFIVEDLTKKGEEGLLAFEGIGEKAVKEIKRKLGRMGLALK